MSKANGIVVFGSTDVTVAVLEAVAVAAIPIVAVVSSGAEFRISYSPTVVRNARAVDVAGWCTARSVPCLTYDGYAPLTEFLSDQNPALGLAAGWYHMIPARVRNLFAHGCLGFHASLLPRLRGGAPLNWALLNGDMECGMTLFEMTDGVDDGAIYAQRRTSIGDRTMVGELVDWSQATCAEMAVSELPSIIQGRARPVQQEGVATYGLQRAPEDGEIVWTRPAAEIDRLIRAVTRPYPGAFTHLGADKVTIWKSQPLASPVVCGKPGQLFRLPGTETIAVVTGSGLIAIEDATGPDGANFLATLAKASQRRFTGPAS
ncbi:MAG: methionyl-tRNA formyltransferase [Hyphomicrobiaceae bacterium]